LNGTYQLLFYVDQVNIMGKNINTIQRRSEVVLGATGEVGLEVNTELIYGHILSLKCRKESQFTDC